MNKYQSSVVKGIIFLKYNYDVLDWSSSCSSRSSSITGVSESGGICKVSEITRSISYEVSEVTGSRCGS